MMTRSFVCVWELRWSVDAAGVRDVSKARMMCSQVMYVAPRTSPVLRKKNIALYKLRKRRFHSRHDDDDFPWAFGSFLFVLSSSSFAL